MKRPIGVACSFAIVALLAHGGLASAAPPPITVSPLPSLPGGISSSAAAVNDAGQIVGWATTATGAQHAVVWRNGRITDLGTLAGDSTSFATAISGNGLIVGVSGRGDFINDPANENAHGVMWRNGVIIDLGTLPGGTFSFATGVNNAGQVVGVGRMFISASYPGSIRGFLWQSGQMTVLEPLQPTSGLLSTASSAYGINDGGQIVGSSAAADLNTQVTVRHAVTWQDGVATDLGTVADDPSSGANAISKTGEIVGFSGDIESPGLHAVRWSPDGQVESLARLSGEVFSIAVALNKHGVIVGQCAVSTLTGCRWEGDNVASLLPLPTGAYSTALGINTQGLVVGYSQDPDFVFHAVTWRR